MNTNSIISHWCSLSPPSLPVGEKRGELLGQVTFHYCHLSIEESLTDTSLVCFQTALVYTSSTGNVDRSEM